MTTLASGASPGPIIVFMKPSSITGAKANKPIRLGTNCTKRANIAGTAPIAGGMNTSIVGTPTTIGTTMTMTTIVTAITIIRSANFNNDVFVLTFQRRCARALRLFFSSVTS